MNQLDAVWNVEEHRYTKSDEDKKALEKEIVGAEMIPEAPTHMSFAEKFIELQVKMLMTNQENVQNHNYASGWYRKAIGMASTTLQAIIFCYISSSNLSSK